MPEFAFHPSPRVSENMRKIRSKDTAPEIAVRKTCRTLGFSGYRLHREDLPGKPDLVFVRRKIAIFVHGCFWHGHSCKVGLRKPKTNQIYWIPKVERNKKRDSESLAALQLMGWKYILIWECETKNQRLLSENLNALLSKHNF